MDIRTTSAEFVGRLLPARERDADKYRFGRVLLLCGSVGYTGAAALAARAALRTGSGLIFLGVPERVYPILAAKLDEPMVFPLPDDGAGRLSALAESEVRQRLLRADACLIGPGLGRSPDILRLVQAVLSCAPCPVVVDADGLNALAGHIDVVRGAAGPVVLTPHEGEFARLGGRPELGREEGAVQLARETGAIVVRKGRNTVITDGETLYRNATGNPGMAAGGSGDVLAGIITSLLGQRVAPLEAAAAGAWLHGAAGDLAAAERGEYGLTPGDMVEALPRLLK